MFMSNALRRYFVLTGSILILQVMICMRYARAEWWNKEWGYRLPVTIDNTGSTGKLEDYQVLVIIDTEEFIYDGKMQNGGEDIRFIDEKGKELSYWIEKGVDTDATRIWVKISGIPAGSKGTIYIYYGNSKAKSSSSFDGTMTKEFGKEEGLVALYHLDEGRADEIKDVSGNGNDGKIAGSPEWTNEDGGRWSDRTDVRFSKGSAFKFSGAEGEYVTIPYTPGMDITEGVTVEGWINPAVLHIGHPMIFGRQEHGGTFPYGILIDYEDKLRISIASTKAINGGSSEGVFHFTSMYIFQDSDTGKWFHVAGSYSRKKGEASLYINGEENVRWPLNPERFPKDTWGIKIIEGPLQIGGGGKPFAGIIDELRLYKRILSPGEIKAHYERRKYASPEPAVSIDIGKEEKLN